MRASPRKEEPPPEAPRAAAPELPAMLLPGAAVGIDHLACLELRRADDDLPVHAAELVEVVALDALILHRNDAALGPLAVLAELDVAEHRLERVAADML